MSAKGTRSASEHFALEPLVVRVGYPLIRKPETRLLFGCKPVNFTERFGKVLLLNQREESPDSCVAVSRIGSQHLLVTIPRPRWIA
jgi:hypothetical protein